jgi:nucleoside-diphosphate-sugar epimerase
MAADKRKTVLITGGRGFVGRALTKLLRCLEYVVISVDIDQAGSSESESALGEELACDVNDLERLKVVFEEREIEGIIHLAAVLPTAAQREPALATRVNVQGSLNLLEMARQFGVRRFVFGSSLSIYGSYSADRVVMETDRAAPEDLYGAAKLYVEQLGTAYARAYGLEFVSLRIGRVVGAGARSATSAWRSEIFECLRAKEPAVINIPYAASEKILLVHVQDAAAMLVQLMQAARPAHRVYNAACEPVSVGDLKRELERLRPRVRVNLGGEMVMGNPREVDWSRFAGEFGFTRVPMFEQLQRAACG